MNSNLKNPQDIIYAARLTKICAKKCNYLKEESNTCLIECVKKFKKLSD